MGPPREPRARGARVEQADVDLAVLQVVREHVDQRVAHRAWASEIATMIAVAPHASARPPEDAAVHTH
ncbi:MAG: hypothetical protein JWO86_4446, partial [Myxococcaceae bacterium]|nr:hypothetical protein [Myxococcaceae bacterium]